MKKQLILILTLILLVGITAGVLLLVSNMETKQKEEKARTEQEKILISLNSNDINKIIILMMMESGNLKINLILR